MAAPGEAQAATTVSYTTIAITAVSNIIIRMEVDFQCGTALAAVQHTITGISEAATNNSLTTITIISCSPDRGLHRCIRRVIRATVSF